jgi:PiT family inorganic phosphate transporter
MVTTIFFLSSGLFLGWSLGANDAANVFGTAVGSRMIRFTTAAVICSIFLVLGAVISGAGASHTLGKLGAIDTQAGAFIVALSAAFTVYAMTRLKLPVSTSQAIVGSIIGWNLFSGVNTDLSVASKIALTWILCPLLAMVFAIVLFFIAKFTLKRSRLHQFRIDSHIRLGLIIAGAFGSYSLGANNIANVMGVFVPTVPFKTFNVLDLFQFNSVHQLFLLGGISIAVGVFTYSKRVMMTVGNGIFSLSPICALVVVLSSSLVLFLFASQNLHQWLVSHHIPPIPLVPVSSSQAVVGAILGIGIAKGLGSVNFGILGKISAGWVATPIISALISFISLFFMQNVFMQRVYQ